MVAVTATSAEAMLDLKNPQSMRIIEASRADDAILELAKLMTLLPTAQRQQVLVRIAEPIEKLHRLNREHFGNSDFIEKAITDLEIGCKTIASLESTESRLDGIGVCPVCGTDIGGLRKHSAPYCGKCLAAISDARERIESENGFKLFYI